ncbi:hypothetical protein D3C84_846760 [compost metagenome]
MPINRRRPLAYSAAISLSICSSTDLRVSSNSGVLSDIASLKTPVTKLRGSMTSFGDNVVYTLFSVASYFGPRNAKGAISAPVLMPVTSLNSGRFPVVVQPFNKPAANAPLSPPPEMARYTAGGRGPLYPRFAR